MCPLTYALFNLYFFSRKVELLPHLTCQLLTIGKMKIVHFIFLHQKNIMKEKKGVCGGGGGGC